MTKAKVILYTLLGASVVLFLIGCRVVVWYLLLENGICNYHENYIDSADNLHRGEVDICYYHNDIKRKLRFYRDYKLDPDTEYVQNYQQEEDFVHELEKIHNEYKHKERAPTKICRYDPDTRDYYIKYYTKSFSHPWNYEAWLTTLILSCYIIVVLIIIIIMIKK